MSTDIQSQEVDSIQSQSRPKILFQAKQELIWPCGMQVVLMNLKADIFDLMMEEARVDGVSFIAQVHQDATDEIIGKTVANSSVSSMKKSSRQLYAYAGPYSPSGFAFAASSRWCGRAA